MSRKWPIYTWLYSFFCVFLCMSIKVQWSLYSTHVVLCDDTREWILKHAWYIFMIKKNVFCGDWGVTYPNVPEAVILLWLSIIQGGIKIQGQMRICCFVFYYILALFHLIFMNHFCMYVCSVTQKPEVFIHYTHEGIKRGFYPL